MAHRPPFFMPLGAPRFASACSSVALFALQTGGALAQDAGSGVPPIDARLLFTLGSTLGIMAFAIGTAIVCLRATRRAREQSEAAQAEIQSMRDRKIRLEAVLAAEPQMLFSWREGQPLKLLIANLPSALGVPTDPRAFTAFADWLPADLVPGLEAAIASLTERGQAFNLMLRTLTGRHIEIDGRAAGSTLTLKVRDLAGQRLDLSQRDERRQNLETKVEALKALLDDLPDIAWMRGQDRRILWVNRAYAEAAEAASPASAVAGQVELASQASRLAIEQALGAGRSFAGPIEIAGREGASRYQAKAFNVGGITAAIARAPEARAPAAMDSAEGHFRSFDRMATAFAVFDADQRLVHFNRAYADLWGLDPAWLATNPSDGEILDRLRLSRKLEEKADYPTWKRNWLQVYGQDTQAEDEWHLPDGRTLHVVVDGARDQGVTYLYENVTERLSLESRYNALSEVQRETIDTLREGVAVFSSDGALRLYNSSFASIWRLSPRQLDGEPHVDRIIDWCRALYDNPEEWERIKGAITAMPAERHAYESRFDRPDGSVIACAGLPLPDGGTLLTFVDVSDSVRAERALKEKNEALKTTDRLKNTFIRHVSYELRTPLTNIIGFTDYLIDVARDPLSPKQTEYLSNIRASGRILQGTIDNILDLASIDAGAFKLELGTVELSRLIDTLRSGLSDRLQQSGIRLEVRVDPELTRFVADEQRVTQILSNLLANAIGFSPASSTVTLDCAREGDMAVFTVKDQGAGIPEEFQASIFEPFESRAQGAGHRGVGLGLAIAKSLVELHGGSIALKSSPQTGTDVKVWLPLREDAMADDAEPRMASKLAG